MGSIVYFNKPEDWFIEKVHDTCLYVIVGEIDDYQSEPLKAVIPKDVYMRLISGEYTGTQHLRQYNIYDKDGNIQFVI